MSKFKLRYYLFDFDDNILQTNTKINLQHEDGFVDVSTEDLSVFAKNSEFKYHENSFVEFSDIGPRGDYAFHQDATTALNNKKFSPSFNDLIDCIKKGHLFAIVTARAHSPITIKKWFRMFLDHFISEDERKELITNLNKYCDIFGDEKSEDPIDKYLNHCFFMPVSNPDLKLSKVVEEAKSQAVSKIINDIYQYYLTISDKVDKIQIGFSDDNVQNVEKMVNHFVMLKHVYPPIKFYVFDTSKGIKIKYKIK